LATINPTRFLRAGSISTPPLPFADGRHSKSSFTASKLRFFRSIRPQLSAVHNDLEQALGLTIDSAITLVLNLSKHTHLSTSFYAHEAKRQTEVKISQSRIYKPITLIINCALLAWLWTGSMNVWADENLSRQETLGQQIYHTGTDGSPKPITATLPLTGTVEPATILPCSNCHGEAGAGKSEGGLSIPNLSTIVLDYGDKPLLRAITQGIGADNVVLNPAMPRYHLSLQQTEGLLAYLKHLTTQTKQLGGVTENTIRLATLLPLSGPSARIGELFKATLDACVSHINQQGAIYGRQLQLTALDIGQTLQANNTTMQRLIKEITPLAVVAPYLPNKTAKLNHQLIDSDLPVIAPITFDINTANNPDTEWFYFLPSYTIQALAVINYWLGQHSATTSQNATLALVYSNNPINQEIVNTLRKALQNKPLKAINAIALPDTPNQTTFKKLANIPHAAVMLLGNKDDLNQLAPLLNQLPHQPTLLALSAMLGSDVNSLTNLTGTVLLASPFPLDTSAISEFAELLNSRAVPITQPGLQRTACAGIEFTAAGLKQAGKTFNRTTFLDALETTRLTVADMTFTNNPKASSGGAYVINLNAKTGELTTQGWITATINE
jgi:ABC-type branched-subunit amino acid transport system substrate-binding protein